MQQQIEQQQHKFYSGTKRKFPDSSSAFQIADNRQEAMRLRKTQVMVEKSERSVPVAQLRSLASQQPVTFQQTTNNTGLPYNLKSGIEQLSGYSLNDVKVHYNSSNPAQLQAHAYAQGSDIYLASGQERYLPHEAWHVVQQKQGRVSPNLQLKGIQINDNNGLEKEADQMGVKALQLQTANATGEGKTPTPSRNIVQRATAISHTSGAIDITTQNGTTKHEVGKKMVASLDATDVVKGSATGVNWTWMQYVRKIFPQANVVRGHLLNHDLGGFGVPANLYPISTKANHEHSVQVEQNVKKLLSVELQKANKGGTPTDVIYTVDVREAKSNSPEKAIFDCNFGLKGGSPVNVSVKSDLLNDVGGFGGKQDNPLGGTPWAHGNRKGHEGEVGKSLNDYVNKGKIKSSNPEEIKFEKNVDVKYKERTSEGLSLNFNELEYLVFNSFRDWIKEEISFQLTNKDGKFSQAIQKMVEDSTAYKDNSAESSTVKQLILLVVKEQLLELHTHYYKDKDIATALLKVNKELGG